MLLCAGPAVFGGETFPRALTRQIYLWVRTQLAVTNSEACDFPPVRVWLWPRVSQCSIIIKC